MRNTALKHVFCHRYGQPTDVMVQDWDNLLILDACRYDLFRDYNTIAGELESIVSVASTSLEFMEKTFDGRTFHDTVYVSANGYSHQLADDIFHEFISTYPYSQRGLLNRALYENYHPQTVRKHAEDAFNNHPDKRLIVHFMQPHGPYFGPMANKLRARLKSDHGIELSAWVTDTEVADRSDGPVYLMDAAEMGLITSEELRDVYLENLELVLGHVGQLLKKISGKTVITADHGELLEHATNVHSQLYSEQFEHPGHVWVPELRIVPWLEIESGQRRKIVSEPPNKSERVDDELVEQHLKSLGYKQ